MSYRLMGLDRVLESADAPGTGDVTPAGAVPGFRAFAAAGLVTGDTFPYYLEAVDAGGTPTGGWECGFATAKAGGAIGRNVRRSSNANNPVNFAGAVRLGIAPASDVTPAHLVPGGRLSLSSTDPTADGEGGTLYYLPYLHNRIPLWDGAGVRLVDIPDAGISEPLVGLTPNAGYDVFMVISGSSAALSIASSWGGTAYPATRNLPIAYHNGFLCYQADPIYRYMGSFLATAAGATQDLPGGGTGATKSAKRFLWNAANRIPRPAAAYEASASWTYSSAAWRPANNDPANCLEFFRGLDADGVLVQGLLNGYVLTGQAFAAGIAIHPATSESGLFARITNEGGTALATATAVPTAWSGRPGLGYRKATLLELATAGTPMLLGSASCRSGIVASLLG